MAALLLGTLGLGTVATLTAPAQPAQAADYTGAQAGDLVDVRIGDVRPTQPALGYDEVFYKLGRYTMGKDAINKKFGDWCEANGQGDVASAKPGARLDDPTSFTCTVALGAETADTIAPMKTVVVGPGGTLYLTDGHHTLTSFAETPDGGLDLHVRLRVLGNLSSLNEQQFWAKMIENKWTWLRGPEGDAVTPEQLPKNVGLANFRNDNYRSVLYFGRDIGYTSGSLPFQEFYWGSWVRDAKPVDLSGWDRGDLTSYLATVRALTTAQTGLADGAVVDSGFTAAQLGKLGQWNDGKAEGKGEWSKLAKPYSDAKPGKIAYALEYRAANLPVMPAAPTVTAAAGEATVSWSVPASGDRPVTGYTVRLDPVQPAVVDSVAAPAASASIVAEVAAPATSHRFTDVPAGEYTATVIAHNLVGDSPLSPASEAVSVPAKPDTGASADADSGSSAGADASGTAEGASSGSANAGGSNAGGSADGSNASASSQSSGSANGSNNGADAQAANGSSTGAVKPGGSLPVTGAADGTGLAVAGALGIAIVGGLVLLISVRTRREA